MQCQIFIAFNSMLINFKIISFIEFLCPRILHDIVALNFIMVFYLHKTTKRTTGVPEILLLRAGNHSDLNEKEKTMSFNKHVDDHNTTGIVQVSIHMFYFYSSVV